MRIKLKSNKLFQKIGWHGSVQLLVVVLSAALLKLHYSNASVNELRWILAPTAFLVELVSGQKFEFESHAGYINPDHSFVIAASCAGVNFLITAFLMLTLRKLWPGKSQPQTSRAAGRWSWGLIPVAALAAYAATLFANTIRISTALRMRQLPVDLGGLSPGQLHRVEGVVVYFGFLLLLFVISERVSAEKASGGKDATLFRQSLFPLFVYYATTLAIPLVNGAYREQGFLEHSLFVLVTPLLLILPLAIFRLCQNQYERRAISIQAEEKRLVEKNTIAPSAAKLYYARVTKERTL